MPPSLRLAFDQNFPLSLLHRIGEFLPEALEVASLAQIDRRLPTLDDRPLIIALRRLGWDGLITNNYKMLYQPHEIAAIVATKSVVVAVKGLGHDPLRAAGALLLELPRLETRVVPDRSNVFLLQYERRPCRDGWEFLTEAARRRGEDPDMMWQTHRPSRPELEAPLP